MSAPHPTIADATSSLSKYFRSLSGTNGVSLLDTILGLPDGVTCAMASMLVYLCEVSLEKALAATNQIVPFATKRQMALSGTTLRNLEILSSESSGGAVRKEEDKRDSLVKMEIIVL